MLTRLRVNGFKNLLDVDVRFGPFTCVAGANGVGKSNLLDAIRFLGATASRPLVDAALSVRGQGGSGNDVRNLFYRSGHERSTRMMFEAEMIVAPESVDDLGQTARAGITILRYVLELGCRDEGGAGALEVLREELTHMNRRSVSHQVLFRHSVRDWRNSVVTGKRRVPFISTAGRPGNRRVTTHEDGGTIGRPLVRAAACLPRTVLSVADATACPTALCARRELQSWRLLQLEPSALRQPDELDAPVHLALDGSHLPATLHRLAGGRVLAGDARADAYAAVTARLQELCGDVRGVWVDRDERRGTLTLRVTRSDGTDFSARSLPDSMLRMLALIALDLDVTQPGLFCLEEPENGIHPESVPGILRLLQEVAVDPMKPATAGNPLRQVIVNTHSPAVVGEVPDESLLVAEAAADQGEHAAACAKVQFSCLPGIWRVKADNPPPIVSKDKLFAYLNPASAGADYSHYVQAQALQRHRRSTRVADRDDLQILMPWGQ